jgi:hypothetical protein
MEGTGLDPDNPAAAPSIVEHAPGKQFHETKGLIDIDCTKQCHSAMAKKTDGSGSRWFLPAEFHSFVDKDATTLCKQFKQSRGSAKEFIGHLTDDNGEDNFIGTAFNGDRGLDEDARKEWHVAPKKPSIERNDLIKLGQDWVDAMGGSFKGDPSCGCEFKHSKWSGQIHYVYDSKGDAGETDLQTWSNRELIRFTVTVSDGVGTAQGHAEMSVVAENRQKVAAGGYRKDSSQRTEAAADGTSPATVEVRINEATGTYEILPTWSAGAFAGNQDTEMCIRDSCTSKKSVYSASSNMDTRISDKLTDPNHLSGSKRDIRTNMGRVRNGVLIRSITWNLSRTAP